MIGKKFSHYRILEKLGEGGMGEVYLAEDLKLKRKVALKFLPAHLTKINTEKERLFREAQVAAALNHPNICTIYEIQEKNDSPFIVMEYVDGQTLRQLIINKNQLSIDNVINYTFQIAEALQAAHEKNIIHRDIKSANIMITDKNQIKIMDFGLAKLGDGRDLTKDHATVGTLAYMSPEQIQGQEVDVRTDIWSFGVLLYEMLTGKLPFRGEYESAMMYSILNEKAESVKNIDLNYPDSLACIIEKCLQKRPESRFQSVGEIINALEDDSFKSLSKLTKSDRHNLPLQLTSFIGREKEIETVKQLLTEHRLVTLSGAGGCGKTRLALQVAQEKVDDFADGVWFVELAPLTDAKNIPQTIASALQIKEEANTPLEKTIEKIIKDKQLLLIMDNCEHLISACSEIIEKLMKSIEQLFILVTSRESLNIFGEQTWRIPSLTVPKIDQTLETDNKSQFESVILFVDRAKTKKSSFELSNHNIETISRICRRLDGIPLAIELAASRVKLFSPEAILSRLDDRFQLLTGGSRTALERHKTLRATIDWSYDLLSEKEKTLFTRLSVFVGGCDMEAVEDVCGLEPLIKEEISDLLSHLIDKSLVITESAKDGFYRYRILETLRFYASEKLYEVKESDLIRERHFSYFLAYAEKAFDEQLSKNQFWMEKIAIDHENILAALAWVDHSSEQFILLVGALGWFWSVHSYYSLGSKLLKEALIANNKTNAANARVHYSLGLVFVPSGSMTFLDHFEKSSTMWREIGNKKELGLALIELGSFKSVIQDYVSANEDLIESEQIAKDINDKYLLTRARTGIAFLNICQNKTDLAEPLVIQNLKSALELNLSREITWNRHFYADCGILNQQYKISEKRYAEAMKSALKYQNIFQAAQELHGMAMSLSGQKRYPKALRLNGAVSAKFEELEITVPGIWFWTKLIEKHIGGAIKVVGPEKAKILQEEGRQMGFEQAVEYALNFDKD